MTDSANGCRIGPGDRLPPLILRSAPAGGAVHLREPAAGAPVILSLPEQPEPWLDYARAFAADQPAYRHWSGRPLVLVAGDVGAATRLSEAASPADVPAPTARFLADAAGEARQRIGVPGAQAALVVSDRWGLVYFATCGHDPATLPDMHAIEEWLRFLATQCPECGVPDEPGLGEWRPN